MEAKYVRWVYSFTSAPISIITNEAKFIFSSMDSDNNNKLSTKEFIQSKKLKDERLAKEVYSAFDSNSNGELTIPEYLRVWGMWARQ